jgi:hypothetical protein
MKSANIALNKSLQISLQSRRRRRGGSRGSGRVMDAIEDLFDTFHARNKVSCSGDWLRGNIPHHIFTVGRRLKRSKNPFEKFWMVMVCVISRAPDDEHKVFHLAEIVNGQTNCGMSW